MMTTTERLSFSRHRDKEAIEAFVAESNISDADYMKMDIDKILDDIEDAIETA